MAGHPRHRSHRGERWQAVANALTDRPNTSLRTLNLLDPATWPGSIRRAFERLAATGTNLRDWTRPRVRSIRAPAVQRQSHAETQAHSADVADALDAGSDASGLASHAVTPTRFSENTASSV